MTAPTTEAVSATAEELGPVRTLDHRLRAVQVDLSAAAIRDITLLTPIWAIVMTLMFGGALPDIGNTPPSQSWPWVVLCVLASAGVFVLWKVVKAHTQESNFKRKFATASVAFANFAVGSVWSLVTLIFWEEANVANHCFLLVLAIGAVTLFLTSRSGDFTMVVAATMPVIVMIWGHFLLQALWFDTVMAVVVPTWAVQLHFDSWRACRSIAAAHRTRLEMEALACELAAARDEATLATQAKSMFLANMSHELRTPLNAILGFSEIISTEALGQDARTKYREYAGDVLRSGRHLLSLINDLLDVAKIEAGKLELECKELAGAAQLQECLVMNGDRAREKRVTLRSSVTPPGLRVFADERALRQIVINLLSNAVKFTPAGGSIDIGLRDAGSGIELWVRDTGCGIPADQLARIFEPFEQVDNHYGRANGGTGLGLTLVRKLSELHGGTCRIDSEQGKGTQVTVFLPQATAAQVDAKKTAAA